GRPEFEATLVRYGIAALREVSSPTVTAMYRIAIADADTSTEVAQALDTAGRATTRALLVDIMRRAQSEDILGGDDPAVLARSYASILWGDLLLRILLKVVKPPTEAEAEERARAAVAALFKLHPPA
ncbi:MAG TPA: TetR/AcrR family transcriptional regulator C-terminal domain-containing protein, partial [Stellaceae bacterium]|nr:TetR/AcrR family transcriptional regulator C-terminal domain-containing protein [Stellaceae bacterium]